jgi:flagellar assembly protein FliH
MTSSDDEVVVTEQANVISAEEIATAYERWQAPRMVSVTDVEEEVELTMPTVEEITAIQKAAQEEGYATGHEQGLKQGLEEGYQQGFQTGEQDIKDHVQQLVSILNTLDKPLADLDNQLENDLISLVISLTRQVVRRELKIEPDHVIGAVRAALAVLPMSDRQLKIYLHPQDIELVKTGLAIDQQDPSWHWIEDPTLSRGGARLETADTAIDATVETRISSAINKLLGEDRVDESGH